MLEWWYKALRSESGVVVRVDGPVEKLRQQLYAARKGAIDPQLDTLSLVISPTTSDEIWIVKRTTDVPE